mmetsp:Transcript_50007/g.64089  ORF Transcript_50007/g.64089 Transcript_50007/m.64089 type:complete len:216 (+) Transcript_50007:323-970(+)
MKCSPLWLRIVLNWLSWILDVLASMIEKKTLQSWDILLIYQNPYSYSNIEFIVRHIAPASSQFFLLPHFYCLFFLLFFVFFFLLLLIIFQIFLFFSSFLFFFSYNPNITDEVISAVVQGCKKLRVLRVNECQHITDKSLFDIARHLPELCILNIGSCHRITSHGISAVLKECHNLKEICANGCSLISKVLPPPPLPPPFFLSPFLSPSSSYFISI